MLHVCVIQKMTIYSCNELEKLSASVYTQVPEDNLATDLRYMRGFLQLQDQIEAAIVELQIGIPDLVPKISLKQFPYPCYVSDE